MLLYVWNCKSYYIDVTGTKMKINVADKVKVFLVVQNSFSKITFSWNSSIDVSNDN